VVRRIARVATEILRLTFARESLGPASASERRAPRPAGRFLRVLFAVEPLPMDPPAPARRAGLSLRAFLAPEPLPEDPVPPAARHRSRLAAFFAPEKLDDSP
jgi:hypothetical protein